MYTPPPAGSETLNGEHRRRMGVFQVSLCMPIGTGPAAGAALVFLGVSNELTATLLLSPLGTRTLSTGFWALTSEIDYVAAAPYALLMIVISLPLTAVLYMQSKKMAGL